MHFPVFFHYVFTFFGLLMIYAAVTNWQWYFNQRKAKMVEKLLGRVGARIFYGLLGFFFTWLGITNLLKDAF